MVSYLIVFGAAFLLAWLLTPLAMRLGSQFALIDHPGGRRFHSGNVPRLGGLALFLAFMGAVFLIFLIWPPQDSADQRRLLGMLVGAAFVFLFGLLDDWRELPPWPQLGAQFIAAIIAISTTVFIERFTNPVTNKLVILPDLLTYSLTIFWIMGMINTVNWLDGLDGLATGVGAIAALLFAIHSLQLGQLRVALFPLALAGACAGFLPYNLHPARIFLGSAGALTLGYALATLSILAPAKVATALLVLVIPIVDVAWLIIYRWRQGRSPTSGGRDHLHFRLLDIGLSQQQIVLIYYAFSLIFGLLALFIPSRLYKLFSLLALGIITFIFLWRLTRHALSSSHKIK